MRREGCRILQVWEPDQPFHSYPKTENKDKVKPENTFFSLTLYHTVEEEKKLLFLLVFVIGRVVVEEMGNRVLCEG